MSPAERTRICVSPWTALLLAMFITLSSPVLLAALLLAALCHELGHYLMLRRLGAVVETLRITIFGAEMRLADRPRLSYGGEMLAVAAGPVANLLLASLLAYAGQWWEAAYLFAGAQLVLGLFNLLPVRPLDGGTLLWLFLAWCSDPFVADRGARFVGVWAAAVLAIGGAIVWYKSGSPYLLLGALGLVRTGWLEKGLVKRGKSR